MPDGLIRLHDIVKDLGNCIPTSDELYIMIRDLEEYMTLTAAKHGKTIEEYYFNTEASDDQELKYHINKLYGAYIRYTKISQQSC